MKEKFSEEEWGLLMMLPFQVFVMVAGADGKVDQKELEEMAKDMAGAAGYKDELHRELLLDLLHSSPAELVKGALDLVNLKDRIEKIKDCLKDKLTPEEYQRFIGSLFIDGLKIARASGGGFLGMGDKVSKEEKLALVAFAAGFDLEIESISKHFG